MSESKSLGRGRTRVQLNPSAALSAIEELKRRGKEDWGATYYSQMAPIELCQIAGRPRPVQYGALISWLKRLGEQSRSAPAGAVDLVAHLTHSAPDDSELTTQVADADARVKRRRQLDRFSSGAGSFEVNCPSVIDDFRFVLVGELPSIHLHPAVLVQPLDGTRYWYPQVARHNPLRAGRAFACFVQIGNPAGIWHIKRPPLDATVRVLVLEKAWRLDWSDRMSEAELSQRAAELGLVAQKDTMTSRVSTDPLIPTLSDGADFLTTPLVHDEPRAWSCVPPLTLRWNGGAAYVEIRRGDGDQLLFQGTAAPGVLLTVHGDPEPTDPASVVVELPERGRYRIRLYPSVKRFLNPLYEWWVDLR